MLRDFIKNHKFIVALLVLIVAGLIGFLAYTTYTRSGKEPVTVYLVPSDATLLANGQQIHEGTAYLAPGTYTIEASRSGFASQKSTVTIRDPNTATIDIALAPVSDSAFKWQQDNQNLYFDFEGRAGDRARLEGEEFTRQNPITSQLPFENFLYTIGYRADPSDSSGNSIIITVDAQSGYRNAAIEQIRELGYDPTNYKIEFKDYESPFDHE